MSGVLSNSSIIRNKHLQENLGLYKAYDGTINGSSYYSFNTKPLKRINEGSLYDYTHNELTDYSKNIGHLYFKHRTDFQPYINNDPINPQNFWGGEYHDYYDYVNAVYTHITPPIQFIEGLLSTQFLDEAIRVTSPAIVHNPEPTLSIVGAVKTNVNNFSGTDTRTGLLGNQMYAHTLYHGANFNTMRKESNIFINNSITPTVRQRFGNSNYTINSLSSIVSAIREDGRIVEDYNEGIGIVHDLNELYRQVTIQEKTGRLNRKERKELGLKYKDRFQYEDKIENVHIDLNTTNLFENLHRGYDYQYNIFKKELSFNPNNDTFIKYTGEKSVIKTEEQNEDGEIIEVEKELSFNFLEPSRTSGGSISHGVYSMIDVEENEGDIYHEIYGSKLNDKSLLKKTHDLFNRVRRDEEGIYTNLGFEKFYDSKYDLTQTTISDTSTTKVGRSRGRNLLKKEYNETNEDGTTTLKENPFCRTWTYYHQYNKMDRLIRPLSDDDGNIMTIEQTQTLNQKRRAWNALFGETTTGEKYLSENTVLNNNGMVNIAPSKEGKVDIKKCMFSIENLAWKDVLNRDVYLSKEQRGPNGGRIMWFPPYDLNFSENTNVNWESSTFIGRGEKVYTYSNTDRTGTLSFTLLIDHPSTIQNIYNEDGQILNDPISGKKFTDEDILRFFAGCSPIDIPENEKRIIQEPQQQMEEEPELVSKTTHIYVYFPNNYSGHYKTPISSSSEDTTVLPDDDFLDYMVYGVNAEVVYSNFNVEGIIPYKISKPRGYEMSDKGLSIDQIDGETVTEGTFKCCKIKAKPYTECTDEGENLFYYRTDFDLKQNALAKTNYKDDSSFKLNSDNGNGDFTFAQLVYAIKRNEDGAFNTFLEYMSEVLTDEDSFNNFKEKSEELYNIISNSSNISKITITSSATKQDSGNSQMLARRRGATIKHLLDKTFPELKGKIVIYYHQANGTGTSINSKEIKENRYSRIEIEYYTAKTEDMFDSNIQTKEEGDDISKRSITTDYDYTRYENEAQYFSKLKNNSPFLYNKIVDKFKYFTPAFHSVSPEGFNARLTFLQQCTRQGHTIEPKFTKNNLDSPVAIAGNLAFGRMPVCVLRIGDFIYSRILITSMNINYGDNQWDLNPEGVGVQPMMAKVNLGITILGGQSLEGPISKLQNAVTFNHYANAGVYDDRADRGRPVGDSNRWSTDYYYTWEPEYSGDVDE